MNPVGTVVICTLFIGAFSLIITQAVIDIERLVNPPPTPTESHPGIPEDEPNVWDMLIELYVWVRAQVGI